MSDPVSRPLVLPFGGFIPDIDDDAIVLPGATVIGQVRIGAGASVWYGAVVRADAAPISIGSGTNLQDGVILHADPDHPCAVGDFVTVGHRAVVHGSTVESGCTIGMGAVLLNGSVVGAGSIVAAGSVVRQGAVVPPGTLFAGSPAVAKRPLTDAEAEQNDASWRHYRELARAHRRALADYRSA